MAIIKHSGVGISAIAAAVPSGRVDNYRYQTDLFGEENIKGLVDKIGIKERRFAPPTVCASDLCQRAAEQLMRDNHVAPEDVNLLIFVTVSPDYKFPPTATVLQDRLGLGKDTVAFDITMGCSAVLYGLNVAYSMLKTEGMKKCLLLIGDTNSRLYSPEDRTAAYIFGDAGTAMLLERDPKFGDSCFSISTDGASCDMIMVPAGGSRMPSTEETLKSRKVDDYGNMRSQEQAWMRGGDVLQLVIANVPRDINALLGAAGLEREDIDHVVLHQANGYMNNYLAKKLKFPPEKVPTSFERFGNTGGASVPLTMVTEMGEALAGGRKTILLSAFGIGMTWGGAIIHTDHCTVSELVEL